MLEASRKTKPNLITQVAIILLLILLNLLLISIIRYLTIDSGANSNSQFGGFLLSFFIPLFITSATPKMKAIERALKFGSGILIYFIFISMIHGFAIGFTSGLFGSVIIVLGTLGFGGKLSLYQLNTSLKKGK